jgi:GGDEF domain-containing protein
MAAAFGLPAGAWYFRKRDQDHSDARIHFLANFDALSGLANRMRLTDELTRALAESMPARKLLAVHCIDIVRFKDINDRLGLAAGDLMIQIAAERLKSVAGPDDIVARLAGDEFALIQKAPRDRRRRGSLRAEDLSGYGCTGVAWRRGHCAHGQCGRCHLA